VIAVPSDAAKDKGINNLEAGMSFSRESFNRRQHKAGNCDVMSES
jgi:hypothetical protein